VVGSYAYTDSEDALRFKVKPESLPSSVETLTIAFDTVTQSSAIMTVDWEGTRVSVSVEADNDAQAMKNIEEAMDPRDKIAGNGAESVLGNVAERQNST
jgi:hypothetical protein